MQEPSFPLALNSTGLKEFIALAGPAIRGTGGNHNLDHARLIPGTSCHANGNRKATYDPFSNRFPRRR